jgi:hypothetical protein
MRPLNSQQRRCSATRPRRRVVGLYRTHALITAPPSMQSSSMGTWWCVTGVGFFKSERWVYNRVSCPALCVSCVMHLLFYRCASMVLTAVGQNEHIAAFYVVWPMDLSSGMDWNGVLPTTWLARTTHTSFLRILSVMLRRCKLPQIKGCRAFLVDH